MNRDQAQHEHNLYAPHCHNCVEREEFIRVEQPTIGPWFCLDCDWEEGKKAESKLPSIENSLPKMETH